jgi:hypothetical protein
MGDIALRGNKLTRHRVKKAGGGLLKGIGKVLSKFKSRGRNVESKKIFKVANTDDGGPYVRRKIAQAKKGKAKGEIKNKSGHVVGVPHKERSAEAIKKYHGIHKDYRTKKAVGGLISKGLKVLKGPANKWRMEQAKNLKKHRLRTKIEKERAGREARKIVSDWDKKHVAPNPELKKAMSQVRHPKSWKRQMKKRAKETN